MFPKNCMRPLFALAPLAGYTNPPFRALCSSRGAHLVYSEMVSCRGLLEGGRRTLRYLKRHDREENLVIQLFGQDPGAMADAAAFVCERARPDGIDINCGCPVKKVARSGAGAALMRTPEVARAILRGVVAASTVPVTVKFRLGWSPSEPAARLFAAMAADEGCALAIIHGRWATQGYAGEADHAAVGRALEGIPIPILTNGDVRTIEDARNALHLSTAAGVAIGRGAVARPDLFTDLRREFGDQRFPPSPPDSGARRASEALHLLREARLDDQFLPPRRAAAHIRLRSHLMFLLSGFPGAVGWRRRVLACTSPDELEDLLEGLSLLNEESQTSIP